MAPRITVNGDTGRAGKGGGVSLVEEGANLPVLPVPKTG